MLPTFAERTFDNPRHWRWWCAGLAFVGGALSTIGVVVGIAIASKGTDCLVDYESMSRRCSQHPHAGEGSAIALISATLFVLVILAALIAGNLPRLISGHANTTAAPDTDSE